MYALSVFSIILLGFAALLHGGALFLGRRAAVRALGAVAGEGSFGLMGARAAAGVAGWYLAATLLFTIALLSEGEVVIDDATMRVQVAAGGPAARAGVLDGDRIVTAAGVPIHSWDELKSVVSKQGNAPIALEIDRAGRAVTLDATPDGSPPKLLVGPWSEHRSLGVGHGIAKGFLAPGKVVATTIRGLLTAWAGTDRADLMGPVGIVGETSRTMRASFVSALQVSAMLTSYVLPYVALGSVLHELLARRRRAPARG